MSRREYDEDDVRQRANPRGTRPRSKIRPRHEDAVAGQVIGVDRGRFTVQIGDPHADPRQAIVVNAVKARQLGRRSLVVGDRVQVVGDMTGGADALARIVATDPRRTVLRRSAEDSGSVERAMVANAEQLGIVVATTDPEPRYGFIDRCLIAAYDGGLAPLLIVTKADLADASAVADAYRDLDVPFVVARADADPDDVRRALAKRTTVLIGQSGVGKSTLVNRLVASAGRATGTVNVATGRGRHVSTSVEAVQLPDGGWIIDTPGVRSFGLAHVDPDRVMRAFDDLHKGSAGCPRGCDHLGPHCALDDFVAAGSAGEVGPARLASLRRMLATRAESEHG